MGSPPASKPGSLKPPSSPCLSSPSSSVGGSWSSSEWSSQGSGGGRGAAASESNWVEVERNRIPAAAAPTWTCFVCLQDFPADHPPVGRSRSGGGGSSSAQASGKKLTCRSCSSFKTWCECNHTAGEGEGVGYAGHGHDCTAGDVCSLCDGRRIRGFDLTTLHFHSPPHDGDDGDDGDDGNDGNDDDDEDDASRRSGGRRRHIGGRSSGGSSSSGGGGGSRRRRSGSRSEDGFYVLSSSTPRGPAAVAPSCQDSRADDGSSVQHDGCDESGSGNGSTGSGSSASVLPSLFSTRKALGGMQPCGGCGKGVTYFESVMGPRARRFHTPCLRCGECGRAMESSSAFELDCDGLMRFCCKDCAMGCSVVVVESDKT